MRARGGNRARDVKTGPCAEVKKVTGVAATVHRTVSSSGNFFFFFLIIVTSPLFFLSFFLSFAFGS